MERFLDAGSFEGFSALEVASNLMVALVLALATSFVYRTTHSGYSYSRSFNVTLVSVTMTITLIMMIIGTYWVLSLGLVGALSVIRFRSAIKDPKDIAYLFLAIAIGLACSTGNYVVSVIGAALINGTLLILHRLNFGAIGRPDFILTVALDESETNAEAFVSALRAKHIDPGFRSYARVSETLGEYVYVVDPGTLDEAELIRLVADAVPGIRNLSLIAPETALEV